jgi:hypothetical protein
MPALRIFSRVATASRRTGDRPFAGRRGRRLFGGASVPVIVAIRFLDSSIRLSGVDRLTFRVFNQRILT